MTPHEADIGFALERLDDVVVAVFAIAAPPAGGQQAEPHVEYLIVLRSHSTRGYAEVHARLVGVMTYEECGRVQIVASDAMGEPRYMARARRLTLSSAEREAARARAAARPPRENDMTRTKREPPAWHGYEMRSSTRRARVIVIDQTPRNIEPAFADLDTDVVFVNDMRHPPYERLTMCDVAVQIRAGDVDLVLLDVYLAYERGDRVFEPMTEQFGDRARDHVSLLTPKHATHAASDHVFHMTRPGQRSWAEPFLSRFPHVTKPLDPKMLASVLENATRWLRPEGRRE